MSSERFIEDALSNEVDQSQVNAIVGSLENQLASTASQQNETTYQVNPGNGSQAISQTQNTASTPLNVTSVSFPVQNVSSLPQTILTSVAPGSVTLHTVNKPITMQSIPAGMQIVNVRPSAAGPGAKSIATVQPRVVIGSPQVVRAGAPGITLQGIQGGQPGHLLLKTEGGQYQLLRVGTVPPTSVVTAPQNVRLSTASASNVVTVTSSAPQQVQTNSPAAATHAGQATASTTQGSTLKPSDNTKEKCRNFLANLLDLSKKEPKSVEISVRSLIQKLIDAQVEPEEFCDRLERLLNASPQPCLIGFLKKSLPLLRRSLVTEELSIEGIRPPATHVAFSTTSSVPMVTNMAQVVKQTPKPTQSKPAPISILQNISVQLPKVVKTAPKMPTPVSSPKVFATKKSIVKKQYTDIHDDEINDVAAMGGVNLAEESQRILGSNNVQARSIKDNYLVPSGTMKARVKTISADHRLDEPSGDVSGLTSHAVEMKLKEWIEKLAIICEHRTDIVKTDPRYEATQDVKGQLKFLEEVERAERKKREETERELLLRAAKSRSKNEDPEQIKLKAKAKEMQRAEMEELRQREANLTALQAIGPRKKPKLDGPMGGSGDNTSTNQNSGRTQAPTRSRMKRVNMRDLTFMLEQEKDTIRSGLLYKMYLK